MFLCFECGKRPRKIKHRIIGVCFSVLRFFFSFFSVFFAFIPDSSPFDGMITKCMATVTTFNARKLHFHSISKKYFSTFVLSCIYCPHIYPYRVVYFVREYLALDSFFSGSLCARFIYGMGKGCRPLKVDIHTRHGVIQIIFFHIISFLFLSRSFFLQFRFTFSLRFEKEFEVR